jgi:hypothetical protein
VSVAKHSPATEKEEIGVDRSAYVDHSSFLIGTAC